MKRLLTNVGRLFTAGEEGVLTDASVLIDGEWIGWVGSVGDRPPTQPDEVIDVEGALVTPGLIDAHTHPVYAGDRLDEIARRSAGASYTDIAASGGGITATVTATRDASPDELRALVVRRLASWLANGTTTVEAKTGYHLDRDGELGAVALLAGLAAMRRPAQGTRPTAVPTGPAPGGTTSMTGTRESGASTAAAAGSIGSTGASELAASSTTRGDAPRVEVTFLGAHDVDPAYARRTGAHDEQAAAVAGWCPEAARLGARFVDVFCDDGYFTVDQARRVLRAGREAGLGLRIHADELARSGGSLLAAELGAVSADHLLCVTADDAAALAAAGTVATLCPLTALAMGRIPPARLLADHGVALALGTDHNPGQSGSTSMSLVVGLAVHLLGLSVGEALAAATRGGAQSVAAPDRGQVRPGLLADLVAWDAGHEGAFAWDLSLRPRQVWLAGQPV